MIEHILNGCYAHVHVLLSKLYTLYYPEYNLKGHSKLIENCF